MTLSPAASWTVMAFLFAVSLGLCWLFIRFLLEDR